MADFAFGAAADRTNVFAFSGTEARCFSLCTNRTSHMGTRGIDDAAEYRSTARNTKVAGRSGHDDFVLEASRGNDQQKAADSKKGEAIGPEMHDAGAAQNHAAGDVDEIGGRNEVADARRRTVGMVSRGKIYPEKKDARQNGAETPVAWLRPGNLLCWKSGCPVRAKRKDTAAKGSASSNTLP